MVIIAGKTFLMRKAVENENFLKGMVIENLYVKYKGRLKHNNVARVKQRFNLNLKDIQLAVISLY
jgi:hypothetical protein